MPRKKIALIGSAPSSVRLAPYQDTSWDIWACSPGSIAHVPRANLWFELHYIHPTESWFSEDYFKAINALGCECYVVETPVPWLAKPLVYPKDAMLREFGPWFFTSSLSWMFAMAILEDPDEIGLWGVDMSHQSEWEFQRSGCHYFIEQARKRGIKVTLPLESDLGRPPPLYGFQEFDHMYRKLRSRKLEISERQVAAEAEMLAKRDELMFLRGAADALEYDIRTWVSDPYQQDLAERQPESLKAIEAAESTLKVMPEAIVEDNATGYSNGHAQASAGEEARG